MKFLRRKEVETPQEIVVGDRTHLKIGSTAWQYKNKIGAGNFGNIYIAYQPNPKYPKELAVKTEDVESKEKRLVYEAQILAKLQVSSQRPTMYYFGTQGTSHVLAMEPLAANLSQLKNYFSGKLQYKTVLAIGFQMMSQIRNLHDIGVVHRDIKPENIMIGLGEDANKIFLVDFGLSMFYRDEENNHIPLTTGNGLVGTPRYISRLTHMGVEYCRRCDLESIGYLLVYLLAGALPWQGLQSPPNYDTNAIILGVKMQVVPHMLCENLPPVFKEYFLYLERLGFGDVPDYEYLLSLWSNAYDARFPGDVCSIKDAFEWLHTSSTPSTEKAVSTQASSTEGPEPTKKRMSIFSSIFSPWKNSNQQVAVAHG